MSLKHGVVRLPYKEYRALCDTVVFPRDHWKCRHCKTRNNLHAHHIIFRSQQGPDTDWNLLTLCSKFDTGGCHEAVHRGDLEILGPSDPVDANRPLRFMRRNGWTPQ